MCPYRIPHFAESLVPNALVPPLIEVTRHDIEREVSMMQVHEFVRVGCRALFEASMHGEAIRPLGSLRIIRHFSHAELFRVG